MSETIIIALISLLGTLGGTFGGILATSIREQVKQILIDLDCGELAE